MMAEIIVDIEEHLCTGHGCKNFFRKMKTLGVKFPELKKISMVATNALRYDKDV